MAVVDRVIPDPQPEVRILLTAQEAKALSTLLGSGVHGESRRLLGLDDLNKKLKTQAPEARNAAFGFCAELEYYYD